MSFTQKASTSRYTSSSPWASGRNDNDGLCYECAKLDLEQSFTRAFNLYEGARRGKNTRTLRVYRSDVGPAYLGPFHYVTSLGDRLSRVTHCKLCNFFRQTTADPSKGTYKLLAVCSTESYLFKLPEKDSNGKEEPRPWAGLDHNVFMAVVPEVPLIPKIGIPLRWLESELPKNGSIYRQTPWKPDEKYRITRPRELRPRADLGLVDEWLSDCRKAHDHCGPKKSNGMQLPGFRAINCMRTPLVVEERPWSEKYVALSYVWGPPSGDWPPTILDAVEVTKRLGERYLWVDRLCINQSDLEEKQFLISKMDAIYEGAEFTIVAAAGDARTGLPGVMKTPRKPQPRVELMQRNGAGDASVNNLPDSPLDLYIKLLGVTTEEYKESLKDDEWQDMHRSGFKSKMTLDWPKFKKEKAIREKYDISSEHLTIFQDFADDLGYPIDEWMVNMKDMAQKKGIPLQELGPHLLRDIATKIGMPEHEIARLKRRPAPPVTPSSKIQRPPLPGQVAGRTILLSTLEDPRVAIRNSEWATRGWTYQEGVLSSRRLVFTEHQVYWECGGMARNESLDLLDLYDPCGTRLADYMLSGIFDGDLHRVPQLQYGYKPLSADEVSEQALKLDSHIRAFTSRNLSHDSDSMNAFLGVSARYSSNNNNQNNNSKGLCLLLGMPIWSGRFANGKPGVQHTFALSISAWKHDAQQVEEGAEMFVADCPRRVHFPSWTWTGWKGQVEFSAATGEEGDPAGWADSVHVDFFKAMTSKDWVNGINRRLWSADMILHSTDGSEATLMLTGHEQVVMRAASDPRKTWLLTIQEPLVLRHMHLMPSTVRREWRRLMGKRVQLHLSVPMTEADLIAGHNSGELVTVLVFASTVPFIFNGTARFLILRAKDGGRRWERIGRLAMMIEEGELNGYKSSAGMIASMPVRSFGRDVVLI